MKRIAIIAAIFALGLSTAFSQRATDRIKSQVASKDFPEAMALIPQGLKETPKDHEFAALCGDVYSEMDRPDSALICYKLAYDLESKIEYLRKVGLAYSGTGQHALAVETIQKAIKKDPKDVNNILALGKAYIKADSMDRAQITITRAREMDKKNPEASAMLGDLYFNQKPPVYELAKTNYETALSLNDNLIEARQNLAICYGKLAAMETDQELANKLYDMSLTEWNKLTKQDPKNAKAFLEQGKLFYFSNRKQMAAASLAKYVELRPTGSLGRWYLAQSLYEFNDYEKSAPHLEIVAKEIDSVKAKATMMLSRALYYTKKHVEAKAAYDRLKTFTSAIEDVDYENHARAALFTGDTTSFINLSKQYVDKPLSDEKRKASYCSFMMNLAKLLNIKLMYDDAIKYFLKYTNDCGTVDSNKSQSSYAFYTIGTALFNTERPDSSKEYFTKALALNPSDYKSYIYLGDYFAKNMNTDSATIMFKSAIEITANDTTKVGVYYNTRTYLKICQMLYKDKNHKDLAVYSKEWIQKDPENAFAYLYSGLAYLLQNDKENMCRVLKKAQQLNPQDKTIRDLLKNCN